MEKIDFAQISARLQESATRVEWAIKRLEAMRRNDNMCFDNETDDEILSIINLLRED